MDIIFATNNAHKLTEVQAVLGPGYKLLTPRDCGVTEEIPEEQDTLEGNASQKAHYLHERTGMDCFADDTGLEVEALGGAPGVHSARYATDGHDFAANNRLLLKNLKGKANRRARFRTVISLLLDGEEHLFEGIVEGRIIDRETGHEGFGFDPLFIPDGYDRTFAQMTTGEKNEVSHRARAVRKLAFRREISVFTKNRRRLGKLQVNLLLPSACTIFAVPMEERNYNKVERFDAKAIEELKHHYTEILRLLGEDPAREGLQKTPERVAKAMSFLTKGYDENPLEIIRSATFREEYKQMVLVKDIELYSLCEHHMLPFYGKAHVAYIPNGHITGLSKIARVVECFARRLQVQERLTVQIRDCIQEALNPMGVAVVIEASHMCMQMRGIEKQQSATTTSAFTGIFLSDHRTREEFMTLISHRYR